MYFIVRDIFLATRWEASPSNHKVSQQGFSSHSPTASINKIQIISDNPNERQEGSLRFQSRLRALILKAGSKTVKQ